MSLGVCGLPDAASESHDTGRTQVKIVGLQQALLLEWNMPKYLSGLTLKAKGVSLLRASKLVTGSKLVPKWSFVPFSVLCHVYFVCCLFTI
jgi:hypothetical protein